MLRSRRCTECGNLFMSVAETTCGTCRGETPLLVSDHDIAQIALATQAPPKATQQVDPKAALGLTASQGVTEVGPTPAKKRRTRKAPNAAPPGNT